MSRPEIGPMADGKNKVQIGRPSCRRVRAISAISPLHEASVADARFARNARRIHESVRRIRAGRVELNAATATAVQTIQGGLEHQ